MLGGQGRGQGGGQLCLLFRIPQQMPPQSELQFVFFFFLAILARGPLSVIERQALRRALQTQDGWEVAISAADKAVTQEFVVK